MPGYTTNKQIIKPTNGEYPDSWDVPVNQDWDIIDRALGSSVEVDVTSGDSVLTVEECQNQRILITGFPSPAIRYISVPAGIGGMWILNNKSNGTVRFTVVGSASYLQLATDKRAIVFSNGTDPSFADDVRLTQGNGITVSGDTISLTSPVTTALGGTGQTTYTSGQLLIGNATGGLTKATLTAGTNVTITNGDGEITINSTGSTGGTGITSLTLAGGLTGLLFTPNTLTTSGTMTLSGTLGVGFGGTGVTSLTGYVYGNGSGVMTASATIPSTALPWLGTMSTQAASAVEITGGTITGGTISGASSIASTGTITGNRFEIIGGQPSISQSGANGLLNISANTSIYGTNTYASIDVNNVTYWTATANQFQLQGAVTAATCFFGTTWTNVSDSRVKTDVVPYTFGISALNELRPINYIYNGAYGTPSNGVVQTGLIAQEVLTTSLASMVGTRVYTDPNTGVQTTLYDLNTNQLVFALINAVKELSNRVTALEAK